MDPSGISHFSGVWFRVTWSQGHPTREYPYKGTVRPSKFGGRGHPLWNERRTRVRSMKKKRSSSYSAARFEEQG
jgi:hypothetical protein